MVVRGCGQPVQVAVDLRGDVARLVSDAQAAAEVVDVELAECGQRGDLRLELLKVEDLRADVGVQAAHLDHRRRAHPVQGFRHLLDRHTELGRLATGRECQVSLRLDTRTDPQQDWRRSSCQRS